MLGKKFDVEALVSGLLVGVALPGFEEEVIGEEPENRHVMVEARHGFRKRGAGKRRG